MDQGGGARPAFPAPRPRRIVARGRVATLGGAMHLSSRIDAVTVYRAGARVTRRATLERPADGFPSELRIGHLPLGAEDGSFEIELRPRSDGRAPIAADLTIGLEVPPRDASLPPPEDEAIAEARLEEARLEAELTQLQQDEAQIGRLEPPPRPAGAEGQPPPLSPAAARLALIELRDARLGRLRDALRSLRERLDAARRHRAELEVRRTLASTARQARADELRKVAIVALDATGADAEAIEIALHYQVPGARWAPSYAIRLPRSDALVSSEGDRTPRQEAELLVRAEIRQRTGEDWTDVALTLSTAAASRWTELPELRAVRIGRRQPARPPRWRPPPQGTGFLFTDYLAARPSSPTPPPPPAPPPRKPAPGYAPPSESIHDGPTGSFDLGAMIAEARGDFEAEMLEGAGAGFDEELDAPPPMARPSMPGGPPPMAAPPPMAPPPMEAMPMASMAPQARSRGFGFGGAPPPAPAPKMARNAMVGGGGPLAPPLPPPEPPELEADAGLLDFGRLMMAGPDDPRRGQLVRRSKVDVYVATLIAQRVSVDIDVEAVVRVEAQAARAAERDPPSAAVSFARSDDGFDYAYPADARVSVASDGQLRSVPLVLRTAIAWPSFVAVPRETPDVFRVVWLENPLDAPLLPGPADVYVAGAFLMSTRLDTTAPRGRVELGLGVEQAIKIARNTKFDEQSAGLIRGSLDLHHTIEIDIANHLSAPARIEVRERVPVPAEEDSSVKVTIGEVEPAWAPWSPPDGKLPGGHAWRVDVAPRGERSLSARYTVRIPSGDELVGGNRREDT